LAHFEPVAIRIGNDREAHGLADGFDGAGHDPSLCQPNQEAIEVIDEQRVQRRTSLARVNDDLYPAGLAQLPRCLTLVRDQISRPAS
jgi:hypothetical protein